MPVFKLKREHTNKYSCKTSKGSEIIVYRKDNRYDWFIKQPNDNYEAPPKNTLQLDEPEPLMPGYETKEEAAASLIACCTQVYGKEFTYEYIECCLLYTSPSPRDS